MQTLDRFVRWIGQHGFEALDFAIAVLALALIPVSLAFPNVATITYIVIAGLIVILIGIWLARRYEHKHSRAYFFVVLTEQEHFLGEIRGIVQQYFQDQRIPLASISPVTKVARMDEQGWGELVKWTLSKLNELRPAYREIHFLPTAYWLWSFALGSELAARHPLIVYHYQGDASGALLHPIGRISREIKDRSARPDFTYEVCGEHELLRTGSRDDAAVVILDIGTHEVQASVERYTQVNLPDVPVWILRRNLDLSPADGESWLNAAAEIAHTLEVISEAGTRDIWLFGNPPSALALMAGTAVGRYRRIHLMQYRDNEKTYREMLTLPVS